MKSKILISNIDLYKNIVEKHFETYCELHTQFKQTNKKLKQQSCEEREEALYKIQSLMDEEAMVIVVFSQMTIEEFCNCVLMLKGETVSKLSGLSFGCKITDTINFLLQTGDKPLNEKQIKVVFGKDIYMMKHIRRKVVHRYPVLKECELDNQKQFERDMFVLANKIESECLRRIPPKTVKKIARAYDTFINSLENQGVTTECLRFNH